MTGNVYSSTQKIIKCSNLNNTKAESWVRDTVGGLIGGACWQGRRWQMGGCSQGSWVPILADYERIVGYSYHLQAVLISRLCVHCQHYALAN